MSICKILNDLEEYLRIGKIINCKYVLLQFRVIFSYKNSIIINNIFKLLLLQ